LEWEYITIARILRPHGNRGEVRVWSEANSPEAFGSFLEEQAYLSVKKGKAPRKIEIEGVRTHKRFILVKIKGIDDITGAEELRNTEIVIEKGSRPRLEPGTYYWDELIGLRVMERKGNLCIGQVTDVMDFEGNTVLQIEKEGGGNFLLPFVRAYINRIDKEEGILEAHVPEGLREL